MLWQLFISGFVLGSISSFHCVGMCGPLALSLPFAGQSNNKKIAAVLLYNLGRVTTYAILGLVFGVMGRQINIAGFQQGFSITAGSVVLAAFFLSALKKRTGNVKPAVYFYTKVQTLVAAFLRIKNAVGFYLTGLANGLLPCGMVYLAVTGAMAAATPLAGMQFMAAFGLGTMPAMMILSFAGLFINVKARSVIRKLTPYAFLLMGAMLILRGLNLGIPFLSPLLAGNSAVVPCH